MKKILILSQGRSGSNYLTELVQMSGIENIIYDPFGPDSNIFLNNSFKKKSIKQIKNIKKLKSCIVKDNKLYWLNKCPEQYVDPELLEYFDNLTQHFKENYFIIKLMRNNLFEVALSKLIAYHTQVWHSKDQTEPLQPFVADIVDFQKLCDSTISNYNFLKKIDIQNIIINYEDLTGNPEVDYYKLGLELPIKKNSVINKKNVDKKTIVINYNQLLTIYKNNILPV